MAEGNEAITRFGQRRPAARGTRPLRSSSLGRPGQRSGPPRIQPPRRQARPVDLDHMRTGYVCSLLLHLALAVLVIVGVPNLFHREPVEPQPIAVTLVNAADVTRATRRNPHPVREAKVETPPPPVPSPKPEPPKEEPVPPPPAPPPPSAEAAPTPTPVPEPKPEPPKPEPPKPAPPPVPVPTPEPKPAPPPKPEPKPEPPKPVAKQEPPKPQKQEQAFDQLLKNLTRQQPVPRRVDQPPKPQKSTPATQTASAQPDAPLGEQLSTSEKDMLVEQIRRCWNFDPGSKDAEDMQVLIHVDVDPDGTLRNNQVVDRSRMGDPVWRAFAESALRATLNPQCQPLKVPSGKYDQMKSITLRFTPKDFE